MGAAGIGPVTPFAAQELAADTGQSCSAWVPPAQAFRGLGARGSYLAARPLDIRSWLTHAPRPAGRAKPASLTGQGEGASHGSSLRHAGAENRRLMNPDAGTAS
jgi:hypothetical protein